MATKKTYQDAITALNSLQSNYANIMAIRATGNRKNMMNIWEMQEWSRRIGYLVSDFNQLSIIHITGTKGKGSTAAFTHSILQKYKETFPHNTSISKIGLYTSPHLKSVRERIRIDGVPISEELFTKYFFEVWNKLDASSSDLEKFPHMVKGAMPGYFKYLTLLSFHVFMKEGCNTCIYEVGVGGEYDSTNIIEKPTVCGVSLLGIDHTFMLGDTIEEIAWNKAGIFKKNSPAFTIEGQPKAGLKVLKERSIEKDTSLTIVPNLPVLNKIRLGIAGDFQIMNASLAVALALTHLAKINDPNAATELPISTTDWKNYQIPQTVLNALEKTTWPGRCQIIKDSSNDNMIWYLDGAHTKDSVEASSHWFAQEMIDPSNNQIKKSYKILLFNQQSRDANALIKNLYDVVYPADVKFDKVIFTTNVTWATGDYSADLVSMNTSKEQVDTLEVQKKLRDAWKHLDPTSEVEIVPSIEEARSIINKVAISNKNNISIFVTGSLHLVGGLMVVFDGKK
ncbi:related to Folylpolyglutamate synthase [Saccharomycodes ludwigii]|uniref:Folylpolyglutamate synthase n=1 Tax=Saccharomycodes ludwigii TaxID=36035 RepID=A0A376B1F5_9ASCO|nr:hypothetical protein SCDLUD_002150 [Saccharomycodes ludwigii]KAH3902330.1 hypothetical protein SCDLUD_002150 [Saccharomycodes ludwigii]SSD58526.1 related to Folylpolyglutamate synthase [Saccharomycodes ludwigii]